MSFLKKPFKKLKDMNSNTSSTNSSSDALPSKTEGISTPKSNVEASTNGVANGTANGTAKGAPLSDTATNGSTKETGISRSIAVAFSSAKDKMSNESGTSTPERSNSRRQSREIMDMERKRRSVDKERVKAETKKRESMARIEDERFLKEGPPELTKLYRPYSMNMSKKWNADDRLLFKNIKWDGMYFPAFVALFVC